MSGCMLGREEGASVDCVRNEEDQPGRQAGLDFVREVRHKTESHSWCGLGRTPPFTISVRLALVFSVAYQAPSPCACSYPYGIRR